MPVNSKRCSSCHEIKPVTEFHPAGHPVYTKRLAGYCKKCSVEKARKWRAKKRDAGEWEVFRRRYARTKTLKRYGMTDEQYNGLLASQNGKCAICLKDFSWVKRQNNNPVRNLCVDHDHTTGSIRGLLCLKCNGLLGRLEANLELLPRA